MLYRLIVSAFAATAFFSCSQLPPWVYSPIRPSEPVAAYPPTISITKNETVADASLENPSGVIGKPRVKIASAFLTLHNADEDFIVPKVELMSGVGDSFGRVFYNLVLFADDIQIGSTHGALSGNGPYAFYAGRSLRLAVDKPTITLDVYATISTQASLEDINFINSDAYGAIIFLPIEAVGAKSYRLISTSPLKELQRVYVVDHGRLEIRTDLTLSNVSVPNYEDYNLVIERSFLRAVAESIQIKWLPFLVPESAQSPWGPHMYTVLDGDTTYRAWTTRMEPGVEMRWDFLFGDGTITVPEGKEMELYFMGTGFATGGSSPVPAGSIIQIDFVKGNQNAIGLTSAWAISTPAAKGVPRPVVSR